MKRYVARRSRIIRNNIDGKIFEFEIDNSTNFKDLNLTISKDGKILRTLEMQNSTEEKTLEIAGIKFSGVMLQIVKEFINQ